MSAALDPSPIGGTTAPLADRTEYRHDGTTQRHRLFERDGQARGDLAEAVATARWCPLRPPVDPPASKVTLTRPGFASTFTAAVTKTIRNHADRGDFRVFSPDELASNRLAPLVAEPWTHELLAEEVLLEWLAGWTASGRRGVLISYEAFAPLLTSGLISHIKQRQLPGATGLPSLNLLLTSYGWQNVHTHGDPSLATALLALCVPMVRVLTPADPARVSRALDVAFSSTDRVNIVIAGKHPSGSHPSATIDEELARGLAVWPHLSDDGEPDLTIVIAGDLPAAVATRTVDHLRVAYRCRIRIVNLLNLTVLGSPLKWPAGLSAEEEERYLGAHAAVLVLTLGHAAAVWGLLAGRLRRPVEVIGWQEPGGPMPQRLLAQALGMDQAGVERAAGRLLTAREAAS